MDKRVEKLKDRLAAGDISLEEYHELCQVLEPVSDKSSNDRSDSRIRRVAVPEARWSRLLSNSWMPFVALIVSAIALHMYLNGGWPRNFIGQLSLLMTSLGYAIGCMIAGLLFGSPRSSWRIAIILFIIASVGLLIGKHQGA